MKKLFIGNVPYATSESSLKAFFSAYEPLTSVKIVMDPQTGQSRGFAFIELGDTEAAQAISNLDGKTLDGKALRVSEARPKNDRGDSSSFNGNRGGSYRGGSDRRSSW